MVSPFFGVANSFQNRYAVRVEDKSQSLLIVDQSSLGWREYGG